MKKQDKKPPFFIRAEISGGHGKKQYLYWGGKHGLHSGRSGSEGHWEYSSEKAAMKALRKLASLFYSHYRWELISQDALPFIRRQIEARKKKNK